MADISSYISTIDQAARGEDVRDALLAALNVLAASDSTAYMLNGHPASYFATQADMDKILPLDTEPRAGSNRGVTSGGIYNYLTKIGEAIDTISGEVK